MLPDQNKKYIIEPFQKIKLELCSPKDAQPEPYFSWSRCEYCRSPLGGDRYDVQGYESLAKAKADAKGNLIELSVCSDCYVELCG